MRKEKIVTILECFNSVGAMKFLPFCRIFFVPKQGLWEGEKECQFWGIDKLNENVHFLAQYFYK